jgi:hypothetical protein
LKGILALDLGTHCGWALRTRGGRILSGCETFSTRKREGPGHRYVRYRAWLAETFEGGVDRVYYERVMAHAEGAWLAAHMYGALEAILLAYCDVRAAPCDGFGVGQVKKHWTGHGNAKKDDMIAEARRRGFRSSNDNECDAIAILDLAIYVNSTDCLPQPLSKGEPCFA